MQGNWNIGDLKRRKTKLLEYQKYIKDQQKLQALKIDLLNINGCIEELQNEKEINESPSIYEGFETNLEYFTSWQFMWNDLINYGSVVEDALFSNLELKSLPLSDEEIFTIIHDFFKDYIGHDFYQIFLNSINSKKFHYRFTTPSSWWSGETIYLKTLDETFMSLTRGKNIEDIVNLIHEHGHNIYFHLNFFQQTSSNLLMYSEMVSIFLEFLAYDYLEKIPELKNEVIKLKQIALNTQFSLDVNLKNTLNILKLALDNFNKLNNVKHLKKLWQSTMHLPNDVFDDTLVNGNSYIYAPYSSGFMISLEIYYLFLTNHDQAFHILMQIINLKVDNPIKMYEAIQSLGIIPNNHTKEYVRKLKSKLN